MSKNLRMLKLLLINHMVMKGKKQLSEKVLSQVIKQTQKYSSKNHADLIRFFVVKTAPIIAMKIVRRKKQQVKEFPYIIKFQTRYSKAFKHMIRVALTFSKGKFIERFACEFRLSLKSDDKNKQLLHEYAFTTKKICTFSLVLLI